MPYSKVYYDDIWETAAEGQKKCTAWSEQLEKLSDKLKDFAETDGFTGQAATNMKDYITEVHNGILKPLISTVIQSYNILAIDYYNGYLHNVDSGEDKERYTTIVANELIPSGSIQKNIDKIINSTQQVKYDANRVKNSIADLVSISAYPRTDNLLDKLQSAKNKAQGVHDKVTAYEASRANDFDEIDRLIAQIRSIINSQVNNSRVSVVSYQKGYIGTLIDPQQLNSDLDALRQKNTKILESEGFEDTYNLVINRDSIIKEEEKESREWIKWIGVGVAVVATVAVTVVTAGAASPLIVASVGAATSILTTATDKVIDNYIENGSLFEGMDWFEFGKDVTVAGVGGFVGGYLGALSTGSAIKQPIEKAWTAVWHGAVEELAKGATTIAFDFGEAIITDKPGNEIKSIILEDLTGTVEKAFVNGAKKFVGEYISSKYSIDTSEKSIWKTTGEKMIEGGGEGLAEGAAQTIWNIGEACWDGDDSTTVMSVWKDTPENITKKILSGTAEGAAGGLISGVTDDWIDNKDSTFEKYSKKTVSDIMEDTAERVAKGTTERTVEYVFADEKDKDASKILGDIWEEDLDGGKTIAESGGKSITKQIAEEKTKETKFYTDLKKKDTDKDGKIEVVKFGDQAVTKEDYDAAIKNAGKGAYKDKTAQELLGLNKDTDLSSGKESTVSIDNLEKYSSKRKTTDTVTVDGKYTFRKEYYEDAKNVAGKGEYKDKTAQNILGISDDVDLSEKNTTYQRVGNDKIGKGKEVELTSDYSTKATKLHVSSLDRETRQARQAEKNKQNNKK